MQIEINGKRVEVATPDAMQLGELIDALAVHVDPGDVVVEIEVDGERLAAGDGRVAWRSVGGTSTVRLTTTPAEAVGKDLRADVGFALEVVCAKVERTTDLLDGGALRDADALLGELLEELRLTLILDAQCTQLAGDARATDPEALEAVAGDLLLARERGDSAGLRRVLGDRLQPMIEGWRRPEASAA